MHTRVTLWHCMFFTKTHCSLNWRNGFTPQVKKHHCWCQNSVSPTWLTLLLGYVSVYALWRYPALLPIFRTWPPVIQKLIGGAGTIIYLFILIKIENLWFHFNWYPSNVSSSKRSHVTRCGAAFEWSPRCAAWRLLCCYSSEQQVCYSISCLKLGEIPVLLIEILIIYDDPGPVVVAEPLLLLVLLQCPAQRCTARVWKGEEWVFFTRTWIISGELLSTFCGFVFL